MIFATRAGTTILKRKLKTIDRRMSKKKKKTTDSGLKLARLG